MPKPMNKEMGGKPKMSGDQMKVLGRVMKYMLKNYKISFIIVVACILIQAVTTLAGMMFMQSLVDDYITPMLKTSSHDFSPLAKALGGLAVVYVVGIAASYAYNRIMVNIGQGTLRNIRDDLFLSSILTRTRTVTSCQYTQMTLILSDSLSARAYLSL